jgi:P-type conjugative transfer ATPase TrbB
MRDQAKTLSEDRLINMLATAFGETAGRYILDPSVIEIMLNPDGKLWIDRLGKGRCFTGDFLSPADAERVIYIIASSVGAVCNKEHPLLSAELPASGSRFQGILPPLVANPTFTIRKKAIKIFKIQDYVDQQVLTPDDAETIRHAALERKNILIVGGTGSGKTTLANAILALIAQTGDRVVIIEDTQELQCSAADFITLRTREGVATMTDLLRATMRLRPDRIVIGEVRGPEALALLKAWNTGHPGGCATVHADSALKGLSRLSQLVQEAGIQNSTVLIDQAIDLIIFIEKCGAGRKVSEVKLRDPVTGWQNAGKSVP